MPKEKFQIKWLPTGRKKLGQIAFHIEVDGLIVGHLINEPNREFVYDNKYKQASEFPGQDMARSQYQMMQWLNAQDWTDSL